jgi:hypothetical protein
MQKWFREEHGNCELCDGTGFESFVKRYVFHRTVQRGLETEKIVVQYDAPCVRRCPNLPALGSPKGTPSGNYTSGMVPVGEVNMRLPYSESEERS